MPAASLAPAVPAGPVTGAAGPDKPVAAAAVTSQPASCAVELDRVVPSSGNLWVAGQQIWLGPVMTGRLIRIWADTQRVHVLAGGHRIKTLPSRLDARDLARLRANGAVLAGAPPLPPPSGRITEIERTVNAPRSAPSPARPPSPSGTGFAGPAAELPGHRSCPLPSPSSGGCPPGRDHDRRPADPSRIAARGQDRRDHHRLQHLPDHRRGWHYPHRAPHHQPRDQTAQGFPLPRPWRARWPMLGRRAPGSHPAGSSAR